MNWSLIWCPNGVIIIHQKLIHLKEAIILSKLILNPEYRLYERSGQAYCTSRQVAEEFRKEHYNVIRDIESLDCSPEFYALNYEGVTYKDAKGEKRPEYLMTKDGFAFLAFGYRGKKAAAFKEAYIKRFNDMEAFIKSLSAAKLEHPAFTAAIMDAHEEPKHYHFSNEADMINRIVLGMSAKQYKESRNLEKIGSIRPYLTSDQIKAIETLQRIDIGLILTMPEFELRKKFLHGYYQKMLQKKIA